MGINQRYNILNLVILLMLLTVICSTVGVSEEVFDDSNFVLPQEVPMDFNWAAAPEQIIIEPDFESLMESNMDLTAVNALSITGLSPNTYTITNLNKGDKYYTDRDYTITQYLPLSLNIYKAIKTQNDLLSQTNFSVNQNVRIYLAWDMREAIPTGWNKSASKINVSDISVSNAGFLQLIYKEYNAGNVIIPKKNTKSNYIIFVVPKEITPPIKINHKVYIILYVGDIAPDESSDWLSFYQKLTDYHVNNKIPVSFSFYPEPLSSSRTTFIKIFDKMYSSSNIELIAKSYKGDTYEYNFDKLSLDKQKAILNLGLDKYESVMRNEFPGKKIKPLLTFDLLGGKFNTQGRTALEQTGYHTYFDIYYGDNMVPTSSSDKIDVIQYGISFSRTGDAGPEEPYFTKNDIINQLNAFNSGSTNGAPLMKVNGIPIIPIYTHQQDFEQINHPGKTNETKWQIYDDVVTFLKNDPNVVMVTSNQVYQLRHPNKIKICDWKNCRGGAVSVSVDDTFTSCMTKLESHGYRGTYFLTNTNTYSSSLWTQFENGFKKGHELATHTREHLCYAASDSDFITDMGKNIKDITDHTSAKNIDLISHAYSCGFYTTNYANLLKTKWNFISARGYNFNEMENPTPSNKFNIKSFNSHGYPGANLEPPAYAPTVREAERAGKWMNLVFHNECTDDGVIGYLPYRDVWVDTIGNVMKYTELRNNAKITEIITSTTQIKFKINTDVKYDNIIYKQNLTLSVPLTKGTVDKVYLGSTSVKFTVYSNINGNFVKFDVPFPIHSDVKVILK